MAKITSTTGSVGALAEIWRIPDSDGDIFLIDSDISSLEGGPIKVLGHFTASNNKRLTSLVGGPIEVFRDYDANRCGLMTLEGSPVIIGGGFSIDDNPSLEILVGGPSEVGRSYSANGCGLDSLDGLPRKIGGNLYLKNNPLTSLQGINALKEMNGFIHLHGCKITSHLLGVFFIKGCDGIIHDQSTFRKASMIVNRHIKKGRAGLLACTHELIETGLSDFAQI